MQKTERPESDERMAPKTTRLGLYLRRIREHRGLSIRRLAAISGVSESVISRLETGMTRTAHDDNLQALARALRVPVAALKDAGQRPVAPPPIELVSPLEAALGARFHVPATPGDVSQTIPDAITALLGLLSDSDWTTRRQSAVLLDHLVETKVSLLDQTEEDLWQPLREALVREQQPDVRRTIEGILSKLDRRLKSPASR